MSENLLNITESEREWLGEGARKHWLLDPDFTFLNHGSFGATPRVVLEAQSAWRKRMEARPVYFHVKEAPAAIRESARVLGDFLGTGGDNIAFVENATTGVNAVLRSFPWRKGDGIVFTSHGYGAVNNAIHYAAERYSLEAVEVQVPFPVNSIDEVVDSVESALSQNTKLLVVDHITSPTGIVLPIERLIALCHARDIHVLIDGAHAPGMIPLSLDSLGADYYTGNCHKWLFAAKGCGFLYARPELQAELRPTVISWGWREGFTAEFDWTGTKDSTPWLSLPTAVEFYNAVEPERRRGYNKALAATAAAMLAEAWNVQLPAPAEMRAHMATLPLPIELPPTKPAAEAFHNRLFDEHRIEVPIIPHADRMWIRISAQAYNVIEDYERLAECVLRCR